MFFSLPDSVVGGPSEGAPPTDALPAASSSPAPADAPPAGAGPSLPQGEESFLGTQTLYVMMRLHHLLYERLQAAREICEQARQAKGASAAHPLKVGGWGGVDVLG